MGRIVSDTIKYCVDSIQIREIYYKIFNKMLVFSI